MLPRLSSNLALGNFSYELGKIYSDLEIKAVENQLKPILDKEKSIPKNYYFIKDKIKNFVIDFPKLTAYEKAVYKKYKNVVSQVERDRKPLEAKIKWMKLSRVQYRQPNVLDIMEFSKEKDNIPSEAVDLYDKEYPEYAYPPYIVQRAQYMNEHFKTFSNADEPSYEKGDYKHKIKWLDKAVEEEDKSFNGSQPIRSEVNKNKLQYEVLRRQIKSGEETYVIDVIKTALGQPTAKFTPAAISVITTKQEIEPGTFAGIEDNSWIREVCRQEYSNPDSLWIEYITSDEPTGMSGFFSKLLKVVLKPIDILAVSPFMKVFNKVASPALKKILPERYYMALAGLTEASANIVAGRVSKQNLRKAVTAAVKVAGSIGDIASQPIQLSHKLNMQYNPLYRTADKYSGGIGTSAYNLHRINTDLSRGNKIDVKARTVDGIKVGLAVATVLTAGAAAAAMPTVTNVAGQKTGLNKTPLGKGILKVGAAAATGGTSSIQDSIQAEVRKQAVAGLLKTAQKKGVISGGTASTLLVASQGTNDPQAIAQNYAKEVVKQQAVKQIAKTTGSNVLQMVGATAVNSGLSTSQQPFAESFGEGLQDSFQREAVSRVNEQIQQSTGINADVTDIARLSQSDADTVLQDVQNFGQEELEEFLADQQSKLEQKVENERLKSEMKMQEYQNKYETEKARLTEFDSQEKIAQLEADAQKRINEEQARLGSELDRIQKDYENGLNRVQNQITDFDSSKFIDQSKKSLSDKIMAERDRFQANWQDKLFALAKKYGPQLLQYLMYKYGPQNDYDRYLTPEDRVQAKYFVPPKDGRLYRTDYAWAKKALGFGALGLVALYIASK